VADAMTAYLAGVQEKLRATELARVEAQARAAEERRKRRWQLGVAASALALVLLGGGGLAWWQARVARADGLIAQAEALCAQAEKDPRGESAAARAAADRAAEAIRGLPAAQRRRRLADLEGRLADLAKVRKLVLDLESALASGLEHLDNRRVDRDYADAFRTYGLDPETTAPAAFGAALQKYGAAIEIAGGLDQWAIIRRYLAQEKTPGTWQRLLDAARAVDPDPWRDDVRARFDTREPAELRRLAQSADEQGQPSDSRMLLARLFAADGMRDLSAEVLRTAWRRDSGNYAIAYHLGYSSHDAKKGLFERPEEAIRFFSVAVGIRPGSTPARTALGRALDQQGKPEEALAEFREAVRIQPDDPNAHVHLGAYLKLRGRVVEAAAALREAIRLKPEDDMAHFGHGLCLFAQGKVNEAAAAYREALRLRPDKPLFHEGLGDVLLQQGKPEEALAEFREAVRIDPGLLSGKLNLANALHEQGRSDEALAEYHKALGLRPDNVDAHVGLGRILKDQGKLEESAAEYREAIRLRPDSATAHAGLGGVLRTQGRSAEALDEYREAVRLKPDDANSHAQLGDALGSLGKKEESFDAFREALRLDPGNVMAHVGLGIAYRGQGKHEEAISALREAVRLAPDHDLAQGMLGSLLAEQGQAAEAIAALREAIRLRPDFAAAHAQLGVQLMSLRKLDEARGAYQKAAELAAPDSDVAKVVTEALREVERQLDLVPRLPGILNGQDRPGNPAEGLLLAQLCRDRGLHAAAARLGLAAMVPQLDLKDSSLPQYLHNVARSAILAGCGESQDAPQDANSREQLRAKAYGMLHGELGNRTRSIAKLPPEFRSVMRRELQAWLDDPELSGVRDPESLAKFSAAERRRWSTLWGDVAELLKKVAED
jgi:tetratricopeptide (TPR) repeat protein